MERIKKKNFLKFYKDKKILITGHTGFIGSWMVFYFLNLGSQIYGISNNRSNKNNIFNILKLKKKIKHFEFNLMNKKKVSEVLKNKFDIIIHLAAKPLVIEGYLKPEDYISNNIFSTLNIISNAKSAGLFLNFTTDKVYKNKNKKKYWFSETDALGGEDPYSYSKTCADLLTKVWSNLNKNTKYCNVRSGNIIGGGDWNKNRIITDIIKLVFENKKIKIRNSKSTRPWIHVIEVCICISKLIERIFKKKIKYSDWNIGPNKNTEKNVQWLINNSLKLFPKKRGRNNFIVRENKKFKEKSYLNLSNDKIKKFINYKFKLKPIDRLALTLEWYKEFYSNKRNIYSLMHRQLKIIEKNKFI
jgi:CDP-glucose 4,6-dehydratase